MAAESYKECKTFQEVEDYCKTKGLVILKVNNDFIKIAKILNENGVEVAYVTTREKAYVSSLKNDTKWVVILD